MKNLFLILILSIAPLFAGAKALKPCTQRDLKYMYDLIPEVLTGEAAQSRLLVNSNNETVGIYVWGNDELGSYASVCEVIDYEEGFITASDWHYWDDDEISTNPDLWPVGELFTMTQDEGRVSFKTISKSDDKVKIELKVLGWGESEAEVVFRSEVLHLVK